MVFGFNTDLRVGDIVFHVQTEDRGLNNPVIDTTVYCKGRIVHRRVTEYRDLIPSLEFAPQRLRERLEDQHRKIIGDLRDGTLKFDLPAPGTQPASAAGIQVQLTNPASWLSAGTARLLLEVKSKRGGEAVADAHIDVTVSGGIEPKNFSGKTDHAGRAELSFPVPRTGGGGIMELVVRATHGELADELRYSLKPRLRS